MFELEILEATSAAELKEKFTAWVADHDGYTIMQIQFNAFESLVYNAEKKKYDFKYIITFLYTKKSKFI